MALKDDILEFDVRFVGAPEINYSAVTALEFNVNFVGAPLIGFTPPAAGIAGPLMRGPHLLSNGVLITGRLVL